jgi:hypothetical protein
VKAADRRAFLGWQQLFSQAPEGADRAWVDITSDPRRTTERQHQLRGTLGEVSVKGMKLDQWQVEPTGSGRVWYAVDDDNRTLWITQAGPGHPKETDTRRRKKR